MLAVTREVTSESTFGEKNLSFEEKWLRGKINFKAFHFCSSVTALNHFYLKTVAFEAVFQ